MTSITEQTEPVERLEQPEQTQHDETNEADEPDEADEADEHIEQHEQNSPIVTRLIKPGRKGQIFNLPSVMNLVQFRQELNESIDRCIEIINNGGYTGTIDYPKIMSLMISYYNRTKTIYSSKVESDDSNEDVLSSEGDSGNYTSIMSDRIYHSNDTILKGITKEIEDVTIQENRIRRQMLGLSYGELNNSDNQYESDNINDPNFDKDSSVDPVIYDELNDSDPEIITHNSRRIDNIDDIIDENDNDYIAHNTKNKYVNIIPDIEIITDEVTIDYDDPKL